MNNTERQSWLDSLKAAVVAINTYRKLTVVIQQVVRDMTDIVMGNDATEEEKEAALLTIGEAMFGERLNEKSQLLFYLQNTSAGYCGNSPLWWKRGGGGYTERIDDAEKFTKEKADSIIDGSKGSHRFVMWPVGEIEKLTYRVVDSQELKKVETEVCNEPK